MNCLGLTQSKVKDCFFKSFKNNQPQFGRCSFQTDPGPPTGGLNPGENPLVFADFTLSLKDDILYLTYGN